jgi:GT2 family glycosyltransferase
VDSPGVSIVITSYNRREEVLRAVASSFAQDYPGLEVLVYDDASEDGTVEAIRSEWPTCRVFPSTVRRGYIVNRNRGYRDARGAIVFSLDDDAYFTRSTIVARTVAMFGSDPTIFAVAVPYVEPFERRSLSTRTRPCVAAAGDHLRSYVGCAHAVRREMALALGGYREFFVHQGEERDLCLRALDAGYRVVYGDSEPVAHLVSGNRDRERMSFYGARNQLLFNWLNVPMPQMLARMPWDTMAMLRYRFSWADLPHRLGAIASGFVECGRRRHERRPVSPATYRRFRSLPSHGPRDWEGTVPAPCRRS